MKKTFITCALLLISGGVYAESAEQVTAVSGIVKFGETVEFGGNIQTVDGLPAGKNPDKTLIATVGVTGSGAFWLIGIDPNDSVAAGNAPDQGWTMKSRSSPNKEVKVKISSENRVDYKPSIGSSNVKWNRMSSDQRAKVILNGDQNVFAGDDYQLTVNVAKYIP